jgi:hypothetical protein
MITIYVSNSGDDENDGLTRDKPVRSWWRVQTLSKGNSEMHLMGGDFTLIRLKAEIDEQRDR